MNQELIDRIQQDAVTIQKLPADLDSIKQEQATTAIDYKEKLQAEELRYWQLIGCGKRIDSLENQLETVRKCARANGWTEDKSLADFVSSQAAEIAKHKEDAEQISKSLGSSISLANSRALEIEALKHDVAREHERGNRINSEYEASIANIMAAANKLGRADYESPDAFMQRQDSAITGLKSDVLQVYAVSDTLGRKSSESIPDFMKRQDEEITGLRKSIDAVNADKTPNESLKYLYDCADKLGRGTTQTITDFMKRQHAEIEKEQQRNVQLSERLSLVMQDYQDKSQQLLKVQGWHEENLQKIKELEAELSAASQRMKIENMKVLSEALSAVTADRDRIRAELAAILAEANKSGRCNGDPVQLLKAGQNDLDARIAADREAEDIKKRWRSLNDHAALKGMRGDETTAEFITRQHRLAADRQTALDRASETMATLTSDLTSAIVDKALAGNGAKEINRLSALVAELQVELDDAKGKYGGIMAQLGNETPLQLIERMQRLAQDQRASTIPHDERAMLVSESADLRKRLQESQKAHAKTEHELRGKLRAALATVENQSAAIAEAKQATEKYTAVVEAAAKLKDWASTIRHKVLVAMVHTKAMAEYDNIMKELDGKAGTDGR